MSTSDPTPQAGADDSVPWSEDPALPPKPAGMQYGYLAMRGNQPVMHECTADELNEMVATGVALEVVVPEFDHIVPPSIVEKLWPAVQQRERARRERERQSAFFNVLLFGAISLYAIRSRDPWWQVILIMFVLFGVVPLVQYLIGAVRRRLAGDDTFEETRVRTLFGYWIGAGKTPFTQWCVRGLVVMFVIQVIASAWGAGNFFKALMINLVIVGEETMLAAALVKPLDGEVWRLLTCGLVHANLIHIGFNGMAFKALGEAQERLYSGPVLLVTFFLSVLGGSTASVLLIPGKPSVGASGGIFGMLGFLIVVGLRHRGALPADFAKSLIRSVLFMAAVGILARDYIDNAAHAGGFLTGCLVALPLSADVRELGRYRDRKVIRGASRVAIGLMGLAALWVAYRLAAATGKF